jgi:hypothetical protein
MMGTEISTREETAVSIPAAEDPSGLVKLALEQGVSVDILERLVGLQERVSDRNARAEFFSALANFQDEAPEIHKSRTANITTRAGGKYGYSYAPLENIVRAIREPLKRHGFSFTWDTEGLEAGVLNVVCVLRHVGGHEERSTFPVPTQTDAAMSGAQKHGAALTYGRRQSLTAVLGLTTADDDTDGADPRPASTGPITLEQYAELEAMIAEVQADRPRFLAYLGIDDLKKLPAGELKRAKDALERKRAAE